MGNVHGVNVMVRRTADQGGLGGKMLTDGCFRGRLHLSGDCQLAHNTPEENLRAMANTGRNRGFY